MCAKSLESCPTLCDAMGYSPPGSSVHRILQARIWSALPFPSPGDLLHPGVEPMSPDLAGSFVTSEPPGKHNFKYLRLVLTYTLIKALPSTSIPTN